MFIWVWLEVFRCVRLHATPNRPTGESSRLYLGEELKAEIRSQTRSGETALAESAGCSRNALAVL